MTTTVHPPALDGVVIIEPQVFRHERGFFIESNHQRAFAEAGLPVTCLQSISWLARLLSAGDLALN
jgi:dTDP-4-dehydrorhamnose 3,5-epimerase-like enzyme